MSKEANKKMRKLVQKILTKNKVLPSKLKPRTTNTLSLMGHSLELVCGPSDACLADSRLTARFGRFSRELKSLHLPNCRDLNTGLIRLKEGRKNLLQVARGIVWVLYRRWTVACLRNYRAIEVNLLSLLLFVVIYLFISVRRKHKCKHRDSWKIRNVSASQKIRRQKLTLLVSLGNITSAKEDIPKHLSMRSINLSIFTFFFSSLRCLFPERDSTVLVR